MTILSFQLIVPILLLLAISNVYAAIYGGLKLGAIRRQSNIKQSSTELPLEYDLHYYKQTLDHFNYNPQSYATFRQRYVLNFKYWGGANTSSPIFVYVGEEGDIISDVLSVNFIAHLAAHFKGLLLYIEHRYYGESYPFGSKNEALKNASTFGYLSSEQALADYAQIITDIKKNLSAQSSPVIAVGASYGGMLASWFRLKYPHIIMGALASSAPILYFEDITPQDGYNVVVSNDFKSTSESCYNTIKQSWSEIDKIAAQPNGLLTLGKIFNVCERLNSSEDLKSYLEMIYSEAAQYDNPPNYYVKYLCKGIKEAQEAGLNIVGQIAAGVNASTFFGNQSSCSFVASPDEQIRSSWSWQTCTELVIPSGVNRNDTMFEVSPFDLNSYTEKCQEIFGIKPRPYWATIQFGGHNIKNVLQNFGSNIIFSNGLRDPWSVGGILEDISKSIVAIHVKKGAHCLDVVSPTRSDPKWLVALRNKEIKIIGVWISEYYAKLTGFTNNKTA